VATMEKVNRVAEQLTKTTGDSYKTVIDHVVALQERNVRFAQGLVDSSIKELRYQAESNRVMTQELLERAERQREAFQSLLEESVDAYMELAYAPFSYYKEGLEAAKKAVR
jgi:predicted Zn-dependent peptidase